jgi:ClpA/ClpB-like protein
VFERYTDGAQRVVRLAQDEARAMGHRHVGTEHLMVALVHDEDGIAGRVLRDLGVEADRARGAVIRIVGRGDGAPSGQIPLTPRSKKVLDLGLREAAAMGHTFAGTEHLVLGLVREREGVGALILADAGADEETVRARILELLGGHVRVVASPIRPAAVERIPSSRAEIDWPAALLAAAVSFAEGRGRAPGVRVTLTDGERFFLEAIDPDAGEGLIGLVALVDQAEGAGTRLVLVRTEAIARADVVVDVGGDRTFLGIRRPPPA